jgi:hypothetical protein
VQLPLRHRIIPYRAAPLRNGQRRLWIIAGCADNAGPNVPAKTARPFETRSFTSPCGLQQFPAWNFNGEGSLSTKEVKPMKTIFFKLVFVLILFGLRRDAH